MPAPGVLVTQLLPIILATIRAHGPITFAAFMDLALYHSEHGYYSSAAQRSGRGGDFFTSVDVGPLFGEMVAVQLEEMWWMLRERGATSFDLVEAGAGNGRLARDILDAAAAHHPDLYEHLRLTLVERSAAARAQQPDVLDRHQARLRARLEDLPPPETVTGVIVANELLDALPVHVVTMTPGGLREVVVDERDGALVEAESAPSDPAILEYFARAGASLPIGCRTEAGLEAERWVERASRALRLGFLLLFDYGHEAAELYSVTHAAGTLMAYRAHSARGDDPLRDPGARDLTAHVNLTAVRQAAARAGLDAAGAMDQTYFLTSLGITERLTSGAGRDAIARRLAAKSLLIPGGLGSTIKVLAFARGLGRPVLKGLSSGRLTR
jgi:SAM-dependent MidA family methyltransferase